MGWQGTTIEDIFVDRVTGKIYYVETQNDDGMFLLTVCRHTLGSSLANFRLLSP